MGLDFAYDNQPLEERIHIDSDNQRRLGVEAVKYCRENDLGYDELHELLGMIGLLG